MAANENSFRFASELAECADIPPDFTAINGSSEMSSDALYDEINFDPLQLKVKWCRKTIFGTTCGDKIKEIQFGPVISEKDVPADMKGTYFENITDMTAYIENYSGEYTQFSGRNLTSLIVDNGRNRLAVFKEATLPVFFPGAELNNTFSFWNPIAVHKIGAFAYVLDAGNPDFEMLPKIVVVKITQEPNEPANILYVGTIALDTNSPDINAHRFMDITGTEYNSDLNYLFLSSSSGLFRLPINSHSGLLPIVNSVVRKFTRISLPDYVGTSEHKISTTYLERIDCQKLNLQVHGGYFIAIDGFRHPLSISMDQLTDDAPSEELNAIHYHTIPNNSTANNIAYMSYESKWYMTSYAGHIHTFTDKGQYLGGWGSPNQLYLPNAITPNPIIDANNPYRFRFIVANKWAEETGLKLFAPSVTIPFARVYENKISEKLTIAFASSGPWQAVEYCTGLMFRGAKINNSPVLQTNIPENQNINLDDFPNQFTFSKAQATGLIGGWNKLELSGVMLRTHGGDRNFKWIGWFYWMPSTFTSVESTKAAAKFKFIEHTDKLFSDYDLPEVRAVVGGDKINPILCNNEKYWPEIRKEALFSELMIAGVHEIAAHCLSDTNIFNVNGGNNYDGNTIGSNEQHIYLSSGEGCYNCIFRPTSKLKYDINNNFIYLNSEYDYLNMSMKDDDFVNNFDMHVSQGIIICESHKNFIANLKHD